MLEVKEQTKAAARALLQAARVSREDVASAVRKHETWQAGDAAVQGDVYLVGLKAKPKSAKLRENRQVADGDTAGSRHVVVGGKVFDADAAEVAPQLGVDPKYVGPVFTGPCVLEHPQHQHQAFPKGAVVVCVFQRNLDRDEQEVRARD